MLQFGLSVKNCARIGAVLIALTALPGCATVYVDSNVAELTPQEKVAVANPQPVQLLFEFQTKGVANGQATDQLKQTVWDSVQSSGLFSQVSADPSPSGALLHITINNVPLTDPSDAYAKGFAAGFTFGLAGSTVSDGYICTVDYQSTTNAPQITETMRDAIYTSVGATSTPPHAEKVGGFLEAAQTMSRRIVAHALNDLAKDSGFAKPAAAAPAPTAAAPTNS